MTSRKFSLIEVQGDRVKCVAGDASEARRAEFARQAEGLQEKVLHIGSSIGMSAMTCLAAVHEEGSLSFRFARSSDEDFDAKGVIMDENDYSVSSLVDVIS